MLRHAGNSCTWLLLAKVPLASSQSMFVHLYVQLNVGYAISRQCSAYKCLLLDVSAASSPAQVVAAYLLVLQHCMPVLITSDVGQSWLGDV